METKKPGNNLLQQTEAYFSFLQKNKKVYQNALLDIFGLSPENRKKIMKLFTNSTLIQYIKKSFGTPHITIPLTTSEAILNIHVLIRKGLIGEIVGKELIHDIHTGGTQLSEINSAIDILLHDQSRKLRYLLDDPNIKDKNKEAIKKILHAITIQTKSSDHQTKFFKDMEDFFDRAYNNDNFVHTTSTFVHPTDLRYREKAQDLSQLSKVIKTPLDIDLTLNPETQDLDFEHMQVELFDLRNPKHEKDFNIWLAIKGYSESLELWQVFEYVAEKYSDEYYIPGLEYWKWIIENPQKMPEAFNATDFYLLPGSVFRVSGILWHVSFFQLYSSILGSSYVMGSKDLGTWLTREYIVLLKRP